MIAKQVCASRSLLLLVGVVSESAQTSNRCLGGHSSWSCKLPRSTRDLAACLLAFPDADGFSLDAVLFGVSVIESELTLPLKGLMYLAL